MEPGPEKRGWWGEPGGNLDTLTLIVVLQGRACVVMDKSHPFPACPASGNSLYWWMELIKALNGPPNLPPAAAS